MSRLRRGVLAAHVAQEFEQECARVIRVLSPVGGGVVPSPVRDLAAAVITDLADAEAAERGWPQQLPDLVATTALGEVLVVVARSRIEATEDDSQVTREVIGRLAAVRRRATCA